MWKEYFGSDINERVSCDIFLQKQNQSLCKPYSRAEAVEITNTDTSQLQPLNVEQKDNARRCEEITQLYASSRSSPRYRGVLVPQELVMTHHTNQ